MRRILAVPMIAMVTGLVLLASTPVENPDIEPLEIGAEAPMTDVKVKDVSGKDLTLSGVAKENGLLVIFSCNTCPWVAKWEDRYNPIANLAEENNMGMIALNPNTTARDRGDGFQDMKERADKADYQFYYALDENNRLADAFGATKTPHVYLFDSDMKLVYRGAIDDNAESAENVEQPYLKNAIKELAAGKEVTVKTSRSLGCEIKRAR